ncbi:hypothetical protein ACMG4H_09840 [Corynebacterium glutamicum]|nr:hypothetical protein [Corynebacterium glutamicum]NII86524.1 hypothetical protein [Corynebacterium glutamicum]
MTFQYHFDQIFLALDFGSVRFETLKSDKTGRITADDVDTLD